jgi:hypothetical protein
MGFSLVRYTPAIEISSGSRHSEKIRAPVLPLAPAMAFATQRRIHMNIAVGHHLSSLIDHGQNNQITTPRIDFLT